MRVDKTTLLASHYLNQGSLSLLLGAGASRGLGLPTWYELVKAIYTETHPSEVFGSSYDNADLKRMMDDVKKIKKTSYLDAVELHLYSGVDFNFELAKKELLIALTCLIIGKSRGSVKNIITYNFDDVLEWYLRINGLHVNVTTEDNLIFSNGDVDILHIHGYLPFDKSFEGRSKEIVFTKKEFEDRQVGRSYWKELMNDFFKRNIFLSIGFSDSSLVDDVCPYLRELNNWYESNKIKREQPYGIAFLTPSASIDDSVPDLLEAGIIPCVMQIPEIYKSIFTIAQQAVLNVKKKSILV